MSRKKMLVAEGFFDDAGEPFIESEQQRIYVEEIVVEEEDDEFHCQFCDQGFVTEKGMTIHEKRWCKEKPVESLAGDPKEKKVPTPIEVRV